MTVPAAPLRRIIVASYSRWPDPVTVAVTLFHFYRPGTTLICGGGKNGTDHFAESAWRGFGGPAERYPVSRDLHGRSASRIRNAAVLADDADLMLAFIEPRATAALGIAMRAVIMGIPTVAVTRPEPHGPCQVQVFGTAVPASAHSIGEVTALIRAASAGQDRRAEFWPDPR